MIQAQRGSGNNSGAVDNLLLFLGLLLLLLVCFTVIGIVPVAVLAVGLILAIKSGNAANVRVTTRFLQIFLIGTAVICTPMAFVYESKAAAVEIPLDPSAEPDPDYIETNDEFYDSDEIHQKQQAQESYIQAVELQHIYRADRNSMAASAFAALIAVALLNVLWLQPIIRQFDSLASVFTRKSAAGARTREIISRDNMASFSIADELIKWNELKKEGLVSDEEFNEARDRLLGSS